jgi:hypothetical protein
MQPAGLPHDTPNAECLALKSGCVVFREIPGISDLAALPGEARKAFIIASARCRHAMTPVFAHDRNPIAGEIHWCRTATASCASTPGALGMERRSKDEAETGSGDGKQASSFHVHFLSLRLR